MSIENISAETLNDWLKNDEAILIDVREPFEYEAARIPNAILLPLAQISQDLLPDYGDKKLVIYCHVGQRSLTACYKLLNEDPELEMYNLEGGILRWNALEV